MVYEGWLDSRAIQVINCLGGTYNWSEMPQDQSAQHQLT